MKKLKTLFLVIIVSLLILMGFTPANASDMSVGDHFNSKRNALGAPSLPTDARLNAVAKFVAETGQKNIQDRMPAGWSGFTVFDGEGNSNQLAVEAMNTLSPDRALIPSHKWTLMGSWSVAKGDGLTYGVVVVATYPAPVVAPAPAPVPAPAPKPPVSAPVQVPQTTPIRPPTDPIPEPVVEEVPSEPEEPVKADSSGSEEEAPATPKETPEASPEASQATASPKPKPSESMDTEAVAGGSASPPGQDMKGIISTLTGIASSVLGTGSILATVLFLRHRRLASSPLVNLDAVTV